MRRLGKDGVGPHGRWLRWQRKSQRTRGGAPSSNWYISEENGLTTKRTLTLDDVLDGRGRRGCLKMDNRKDRASESKSLEEKTGKERKGNAKKTRSIFGEQLADRHAVALGVMQRVIGMY